MNNHKDDLKTVEVVLISKRRITLEPLGRN